MKYIKEITQWGKSYEVPNHVYYVRDDKTKMVGYIRSGTTELVMFSKPMNIDLRRRKFVTLVMPTEPDEVYFPTNKPEKNSITISGSNGAVYFLNQSINGKYTCTCPGFKFRNKCKHIEGVR